MPLLVSSSAERFERNILFGFGRHVANFSAVTGLALTVVGACVVLYAYPDKRLADHPVDWLSKNKPSGELPGDYQAYTYDSRFPPKLSLKECFAKNSMGKAAVASPKDIPGWDASLFGQAMIAFADKKVNIQPATTYGEYSFDQSSANVPEGIAEMSRKICKGVLASSTSPSSDLVFWETRTPVLLAAAAYGQYFEDFNTAEDQRRARLIPGTVSLMAGILIAFLAAMSSSLFAIERNTRTRD